MPSGMSALGDTPWSGQQRVLEARRTPGTGGDWRRQNAPSVPHHRLPSGILPGHHGRSFPGSLTETMNDQNQQNSGVVDRRPDVIVSRRDTARECHGISLPDQVEVGGTHWPSTAWACARQRS